MIPYRLWDRDFKDLPTEIQDKLRLPSDTSDLIFYDTLSVEDKKALLKSECGYDPVRHYLEKEVSAFVSISFEEYYGGSRTRW